MNFTKHLLQDIDCLRCSIKCAQFSRQISLDLMSCSGFYSIVDLSSLSDNSGEYKRTGFTFICIFLNPENKIGIFHHHCHFYH